MGGMEIEQPLQCGGREFPLHQSNQRLGDRFVGEVSLSENTKDVIDSRTRRFAEYVFSLRAFDVLGDRGCNIPVGK